MHGRDIVLLSTADWSDPAEAINWTNKQHVARELARRGNRVLYIESLGLRAPTANAQDFGRIVRRLRKASAGPRLVMENLWVWSPVVLPLQRFGAVRKLNHFVLTTLLRIEMARRGMKRDLLWTYNPLTTRLLGLDGFGGVVYHCVDDIAAQPGMPVEALNDGEAELCQRADIVFATAPKLMERCAQWNPNSHFLPNVADFAHFSRAQDPDTQIPEDLASIPGPRVGFHGALSGYKIDFALLRGLADARPDLQIVLIGKVGLGEPGTDVTLLEDAPNIHLLGPRSYGELPRYLKGFDVAVLPNLLNEYNESVFPMKFFEYLGAGLRIVSVPLPAIREFAHVAEVVEPSVEAFSQAIDRVLSGAGAPLSDRLGVAREYTYEARTDRMVALMGRGQAPASLSPTSLEGATA